MSPVTMGLLTANITHVIPWKADYKEIFEQFQNKLLHNLS